MKVISKNGSVCVTIVSSDRAFDEIINGRRWLVFDGTFSNSKGEIVDPVLPHEEIERGDIVGIVKRSSIGDAEGALTLVLGVSHVERPPHNAGPLKGIEVSVYTLKELPQDVHDDAYDALFVKA